MALGGMRVDTAALKVFKKLSLSQLNLNSKVRRQQACRVDSGILLGVYLEPCLPCVPLYLSFCSGLSSVSQLRSDAPRRLSTPVLLPLRLEVENLNLRSADLIVFRAIDSGYQVPTVHWGQTPGEEKGRSRSHTPPPLPTALAPPLVRFGCNQNESHRGTELPSILNCHSGFTQIFGHSSVHTSGM